MSRKVKVRTIEVCPACGQYEPWRQYAKRVGGLKGNEVARLYKKCFRCGATMTEVVVKK